MNLTILTPEKQLFNGTVRSVKVPGSGGQFEVLNGHAPIVSSLDKGVVRVIDTSGNRQEYAIEKGFIEVLNNEVSVLVTEVETD
ncbi:MAG: ATP synthase F1 subunit epsilon [Saprospiraceae bacterium]|nr:ATP synthase F1 subunit epsilon [Saprospiraceae bacterium]